MTPNFTHETGEVAGRFHRETEWYVASHAGLVHVLRVHANSERTVELFHRFSAHLDPLVDVCLAHRRDGRSWQRGLCVLTDVRDAVGRLRWPLASHGGVELTLYSADDQLTLMPSLELVIYSRRDDWRARLDVEGLHSRASAPPATWRMTDGPWPDAPELGAALSALVQRLSLEPGS